MLIANIIRVLENFAPSSLQESYDNSGLITGQASSDCTGIITCLDATEEVILEAIELKRNLIVAHHPIIFKGLKSLTGKNYIERAIILALKNNIAIYAFHTNLDNVADGVNGRVADVLQLMNRKVLLAKADILQKLSVFVPVAYKHQLLESLFAAGAGSIGHYSECSFSTTGSGSFKGDPGTQPFVGKPGERHYENEEKIEVIFPGWLQQKVVQEMIKAHPYEEVAYDIYPLKNSYNQAGSGIYGDLPEKMSEESFLGMIKEKFGLKVIRHTGFTGREVKNVAICGGAGSFLIPAALGISADVYLTSDIKYHEFFDADRKILLADIGHFESEQFTIGLLFDILKENFPNFAIQKTTVQTNPVRYFL